MRGLKDKVAVVTGGGQGIGRALTLRLAEEGCKVAIFDLKPEAAKETGDLAPKGSVTGYELDVGDYAAVAAAVARVEADLGPIWALVNNAGWDRPAPFLTTDKALWDKIVHINLYGPLNTHHIVAPLMVKRGGGRIINIASDAARVGTSNEAVYSACKGGLISFTKSVARELASKGVSAQRGVPRPDQHPDDGVRARRRRAGGEVERRDGSRHSAQAHGRAGRLRRHRRLSRLRRRLLHDWPDHFGRRRHEHDLTLEDTTMTDAPVFEDILYEKRDNRAAWIIINRPKLYNAFRAQTMEELIKAFQMAGYDKAISSIVLTGAGDKAFCTGGDQSAHEGQYDGRGIVGLPIDEFQSIIRDVPKPVIARVNGFAIGGGNVFATLCDLTIAGGQRQIRPGRPEGRIRGRRLGHRPARPPHRRQAGA